MERVAKLMARRGLCSRREAERLLEAGHVLVDGVAVQGQGHRASPDADICITPAGAALLGTRFTVLLHKPPGVVSALPEPGQTPAWKLVHRDARHGRIEARVVARVVSEAQALSVAGRLDRASRGLLVLTQDGVVARRIIGGQGVEKAYVVRTVPAASDEQIRKLRGPLRLDDRPLLPMQVRRVSADTLRFILVEGRKHQIRRVCRRVGLAVVDLFREAVGPLAIGDLPEGKWRLASEQELERLRVDGRVDRGGNTRCPAARRTRHQ